MIAERINIIRDYSLLDRIEDGLEWVFEDCCEYLFDRFPLSNLEYLWNKFDEGVLCPLEKLKFRY